MIQYSRDVRLIRRGLGVLDRSVEPGNDRRVKGAHAIPDPVFKQQSMRLPAEHATTHSRDALRPRHALNLDPPRYRGRREDRVPAAPMAPCAASAQKKHTGCNHRYRRNHTGLPCAVVYDLLRALLGEPDFVVTVASAMTLASSPTWRQPRGARTTRLRRPRPHRPSSMPPRPPHPASRFVTFAIRPSSIEAGRRGESPISEKRKANYFRRALLKALNCLDSARQISVCAQVIWCG